MSAMTQLFIHLCENAGLELQQVINAAAYGTVAGHDAVAMSALQYIKTQDEKLYNQARTNGSLAAELDQTRNRLNELQRVRSDHSLDGVVEIFINHGGVPEEVMRLMRLNKKVAAIKLLRTTWREVGLWEGKEIIERAERAELKDLPEGWTLADIQWHLDQKDAPVEPESSMDKIDSAPYLEGNQSEKEVDQAAIDLALNQEDPISQRKSMDEAARVMLQQKGPIDAYYMDGTVPEVVDQASKYVMSAEVPANVTRVMSIEEAKKYQYELLHGSISEKEETPKSIVDDFGI